MSPLKAELSEAEHRFDPTVHRLHDALAVAGCLSSFFTIAFLPSPPQRHIGGSPANVGQFPRAVLADAGYRSEENLQRLEASCEPAVERT